jgi:hypothetical protein
VHGADVHTACSAYCSEQFSAGAETVQLDDVTFAQQPEVFPQDS